MNMDHTNHSIFEKEKTDPQVEEIIKGARGQAARVEIQNEATELHVHVYRCLRDFKRMSTFGLQTFQRFPEKLVSKATITQLMLVQEKQAQA